MRNQQLSYTGIFIVIIFLTISNTQATANSLWDLFVMPSNEARTKLWWFHGETETTKEGIDADLEAFKKAGIGGVVYYDQTHGNQDRAFPALSQEWWTMLKYAAQKAKELGLTFEMASTNGYVAGGPWISPEMGMQKIVVLRSGDKVPEGFHELKRLIVPVDNDDSFIDTLILHGRKTLIDNQHAEFLAEFEVPKSVRSISYTVTPRGKGSFGSMNLPGKPQDVFFGAGYINFPPIGELECSDDGVIWKKIIELKGIEDVIGHKSLQRTINFPEEKAKYFRVRVHDWLGPESKYHKLAVDNIRLMTYDMIDNWEEKSGLRSEVPWRPYDLRVTEDFKPFAGEVIIGYAPTGGHSKHGRKRIVWNDKELEAQTWLEADVLSAKAAELHYNSYFKAVYDTLSKIGCRPAGMQMDSHEAGIANWTSEMPMHFRRLREYDIDQWIPALGGYIVESREASEKFLKDFKLTISELIREQFYATIDSLCRRDGVTFTSQAMLGCVNDNIASRGMVGKPQGEFWAYQKDGNFDCLDAASAAHLYGKKIASGEAFTDSPYFFPANEEDRTWKENGWKKLLRIANLAYCKGINEFVVCASSYQPWMDRKYDDTASSHPYIFHRHNMAWDKSRDNFWEYQARCSQMQQTGKPVVDILVYVGDELPAKTMTYKLPEIPEGYLFDVCTPASLKYWIQNKSEYSPDYKLLAVQDRSDISEEAETIFKNLEDEGMIIVRCDKGESIADALVCAGLAPDMYIESANMPDSKVYFNHRKTADAEIYFIYNHSENPYEAPIKLRTEKTEFQLWNPFKAERTRSKKGMLKLQPYESVYLVAM